MFVDSLICSRLDRESILELQAGGLGCVTVTCGFWEDATESLDSLVRWHELIAANSDLAQIAHTTAEIEEIAASGRVAILLGFQNSSFLQGRLGYVDVFARMGTKVAQLTYNIQNDIGGSCYEPEDSGLTRFGREVIGEMNAHRMAVDLSHVGNRTTMDAIKASALPVAITHSNWSDLIEHPRNKPLSVLKALAEKNGVIGLTVYHNLTRGFVDTPELWSEMVARTVDAIGIDHVGIGSDANQKGTSEYREWMRKGRWSREEQIGAGAPTGVSPSKPPEWFTGPADFKRLHDALATRGFAAEETAKIMSGNWMRFYKEVLG